MLRPYTLLTSACDKKHVAALVHACAGHFVKSNVFMFSCVQDCVHVFLQMCSCVFIYIKKCVHVFIMNTPVFSMNT